MKWPKGLKEINQFYGNPRQGDGSLDSKWYQNNIVRAQIPGEWKMYLSWDKTQRVRTILIHTRCKESLERILNSIWFEARVQAKAKNTAPASLSGATLSAWWDDRTNEVLHQNGLDLFGGSFNFRPIRGRVNLSTHAYGCSVDLDPESNQLGAKGTMAPWVVKIFEDEGWTWGGKFKKRPDFMHFQACSGY